jgi:DNA polymerase III subunit delta'
MTVAPVFVDLVGQEHVVEVLERAVHAAEGAAAMTHAWLFTGPPGSGRSNAAVAFAKALVCASNGCDECEQCRTVKAGSNADVEVMRTEGLSIKADDIRELVVRSAWAPSGAAWRVVVIEDADRLTEAAGNALLKAVEEPGERTVWLLCAPSLEDVTPTIRSRCRHLALRTPPVAAVAEVLIRKFNVDSAMASYAAHASQGHIGRARWLATDEHARARRREMLQIPASLTSIGECMAAAQMLVDSATSESKATSQIKDTAETESLKLAWGHGATGRGLPTGASKALKELEKDQKARATRTTRDILDRALIDLSTFFRDVLVTQQGATVDLINEDHRAEISLIGERTSPESTLTRLEAINKTRESIAANVAPLLAMEALMLTLRLD